MKVRVFTLLWRPDGGGFDDALLEEFLATRTAIDVSEHFFVHEKTPVLVLVVTYRGEPEARPPRAAGQGAAPDVAADLTEGERRRYEALRTWRNQYARREGKPPYIVFTNRQAAAIARKAPATRAQLGEIEGIGESRIEDFGEELLAVLAAIDLGAAAAPEAAARPDRVGPAAGASGDLDA